VQHPKILDSVVVSESTYVAVEASETADGVQTFECSKRKRAPAHQNQLDDSVNDSHFNNCLCGSVVIPTSDGALMCKQVGCETQWVVFLSIGVLFSYQINYLVSFTVCFT